MLPTVADASPDSSRILIADLDLCLLQSLPPYLQEVLPNCEVDLCASHETILQKLLAAPYQLIISGVHLAEIKDFFLLEQTKLLQPLTPFVVTTKAEDLALAQKALHRGAFDLITKPLDAKELGTSLRLVRQHHELRDLLALERRAWETYHRALTIAQTNQVHPMHENFKRLATTYRATIQRVDECMGLLNDMMRNLRTHAHARAIERLKLVGNEKWN